MNGSEGFNVFLGLMETRIFTFDSTASILLLMSVRLVQFRHSEERKIQV